MVPANSSGMVISTRHDRFQQRGLGGFHGFAEGDAAGHLEGEVVGIDVVVRAVVEDDAEIHDGIAGEKAAGGGVFDSLFDGGNVVLRDGAAEDVVDELEFDFAPSRGSGSILILQSPYWPWPPVCFLWRP